MNEEEKLQKSKINALLLLREAFLLFGIKSDFIQHKFPEKFKKYTRFLDYLNLLSNGKEPLNNNNIDRICTRYTTYFELFSQESFNEINEILDKNKDLDKAIKDQLKLLINIDSFLLPGNEKTTSYSYNFPYIEKIIQISISKLKSPKRADKENIKFFYYTAFENYYKDYYYRFDLSQILIKLKDEFETIKKSNPIQPEKTCILSSYSDEYSSINELQYEKLNQFIDIPPFYDFKLFENSENSKDNNNSLQDDNKINETNVELNRNEGEILQNINKEEDTEEEKRKEEVERVQKVEEEIVENDKENQVGENREEEEKEKTCEKEDSHKSEKEESNKNSIKTVQNPTQEINQPKIERAQRQREKEIKRQKRRSEIKAILKQKYEEQLNLIKEDFERQKKELETNQRDENQKFEHRNPEESQKLLAELKQYKRELITKIAQQKEQYDTLKQTLEEAQEEINDIKSRRKEEILMDKILLAFFIRLSRRFNFYESDDKVRSNLVGRIIQIKTKINDNCSYILYL